MKKHSGLVSVLLAVVTVPMIYNSCDGSHSSGSFNGFSTGGDSCTPVLAAGAKPVYDYLQTKSCSSCHFQGSTSAPSAYYIADRDWAAATIGFANVVKSDPQKIYTKAYDTNHFGGASPDNAAAMDPLKSAFMQSANDYKQCLIEKSTQPAGPSPGEQNPDPTKFTIAKTIPASPSTTTGVNIVWDLGTEMTATNAAIPSGRFQITIKTAPGTGKPAYQISAPRALGSTTSAIEISGIRVFINGQILPLNIGGTWSQIFSYAPASAPNRALYLLDSGTSFMTVEADTTVATNTIAIGFVDIAPSKAYPDFLPTTYARLTAAANNNNATPPLAAVERVFAVRCVGCHNANNTSGGITLATGDRNRQLLGPRAATVYAVMTLAPTDPKIMPPAGAQTGAATPEEIRWVRDWILSGGK